MKPIITEMTKDKTWKAYIEGNPQVCEFGERESIAVAMLILRLQGARVTKLNGATVFSVAMWLCWIALSWLIIAESVQVTTFNGLMWGLFLLFGIFGISFSLRR